MEMFQLAERLLKKNQTHPSISSESNHTDMSEAISTTEENHDNTVNDTISSDEDVFASPNDGETLRNTMKLYGSLFLFLLLIFCILRRRCPKVFNVRNVVPKLKCNLATDQYGFISWIWRLLLVDDDDILDQCGLDALCFLRILLVGMKVSMVGIANSIWLMPIYATAPGSTGTDYIDDRIVRLSATHIPASNGRLICTVIASYIVFGFAMYLILEEFKYFTQKRHQFLSKRLPRNYTVYISGLCPEYRSSAALYEYFCECFSEEDVLEANVALDIPKLERKVANRESTLANLEHAMAVEALTGVSPTHKSSLIGGEEVNSIEKYKEELQILNNEIEEDIARIAAVYETDKTKDESFGSSLLSVEEMMLSDSDSDESNHGSSSTQMTPSQSASEESSERKKRGRIAKVRMSVSKGIKSVGTSALSFLIGDDDGKPRESAFVSFTNLQTTNSALQLLHHPSPFSMDVCEAPDPHDIFWNHVGLTHKQLQMGSLVAFGLTCLFCVFWTVPVSFVASLSQIDSLKQSIPFLATLIEKFPSMEQFFAQLAPLLVMGLHTALPYILLEFARREGPIASSVLEASLFVKLAAFMIIQTFFVSTISGSLFQALSDMISDPESGIDLLANSVVSQCTYFIQIILVSTFVGQGIELMQFGRIACAWARRMVGPNLTEKERNTSWMGLNPLVDPWDFKFGIVLGQAVLYYMVTFVYSSMAPISNYFVCLCYLLSSIGWRHQFIYIYPPTKDSGGKLWTRFVGVTLTCMIIAEFVLTAWLGIKKSPISASLMVPLILATFLFNFYIRQKHFYVTEHLPFRECRAVDEKNAMGSIDDEEDSSTKNFSFLQGAYLQPALKSEPIPEPDLQSVLEQDPRLSKRISRKMSDVGQEGGSQDDDSSSSQGESTTKGMPYKKRFHVSKLDPRAMLKDIQKPYAEIC